MSEHHEPLDRTDSDHSSDGPESSAEFDPDRSETEPDSSDDDASLEEVEPGLVMPPSEGRLFGMATVAAVAGFVLYVVFEPESGGLVLLFAIAVLVALLLGDGYRRANDGSAFR
ncbi:hypothetical protein [Natrononativus amylolyticus]|uniref:hypothetical protein n=1 Tax=Natrononativus amylolyticus TaxID=2963434 RepID=UPI0020CFCBE5|nr:hypothetical protein [Natrononativus amylolyticus]